MPRDDDRRDKPVTCSFCHKTQEQVEKLIAGPGVYICDECIELCSSIIEEESILSPVKLKKSLMNM